MSTTDTGYRTEDAETHKPPPWPVLLRKLIIWALFLLVLYLARDFFFTAFMTFMFSYLVLALVGWGMKRLAPGQERPGLRRLLTVAVFILGPLLLVGAGSLLGPPLVAQGQRMAGWLSQVSPETEVAHLMEGHVGPSEFKQVYGGPDDPRYQKALEEFRKGGARHVAAYNEFPRLEAWVEGGFSKQFAHAGSGRIRARLLAEGTSSKEFESWFLKEKFPRLQQEAKKQAAEKDSPSGAEAPLVQAAATSTPEELLHTARRDPTLLAGLRTEWTQEAVKQGLAGAWQSPAYHEQLRA
jgi:hypothetical protein